MSDEFILSRLDRGQCDEELKVLFEEYGLAPMDQNFFINRTKLKTEAASSQLTLPQVEVEEIPMPVPIGDTS